MFSMKPPTSRTAWLALKRRCPTRWADWETRYSDLLGIYCQLGGIIWYRSHLLRELGNSSDLGYELLLYWIFFCFRFGWNFGNVYSTWHTLTHSLVCVCVTHKLSTHWHTHTHISTIKLQRGAIRRRHLKRIAIGSPFSDFFSEKNIHGERSTRNVNQLQLQLYIIQQLHFTESVILHPYLVAEVDTVSGI